KAIRQRTGANAAEEIAAGRPAAAIDRAAAAARRPVARDPSRRPRLLHRLTRSPPPVESAGVQRLFPALLVALVGFMSHAGAAFAEPSGAAAPARSPSHAPSAPSQSARPSPPAARSA